MIKIIITAVRQMKSIEEEINKFIDEHNLHTGEYTVDVYFSYEEVIIIIDY